MKVVLPALAAFVLITSSVVGPAFAFTTVTVDASNPDGKNFKDPDKLMEERKDQQKAGNLFQSSDGNFSVRTQMQGGNNSYNGQNTRNKNFSDYVPPP